ncbi:urea ABC transporter permease subunit UrtC [Pelagibacteraceae bacterium]|nr:urea ABC transporter permease subunit UrtC [Pelagibacteraceae bacterium]
MFNSLLKDTNHRQVLFFCITIILFSFIITLLSDLFSINFISTSFIKTLGKTLCLCVIALSMDVVWGYCGILSLGHFAFFGLGGYMIGMWLMYKRTEIIVLTASISESLPLTQQEISDAIGNQIFGVVGGSEIPLIWAYADNFYFQLAMVILIPGLLAFVFGWLAFRSRVTGVYLSILTQAMTLALSLYLFQNDSGLRGNNGLSGLQNIPGYDDTSQFVISIYFFWASALFLILVFIFFFYLVNSKFGSIITAIRDDETRIRFLGYHVESYKLFVFVLTAVISALAGALYYPQAGIINPAEIAPIASIYLAVWVAIGGRGNLYGAIIGAASVSLISSWFTSGQAPSISLIFYKIEWVNWWTVILGLGFVIVTLISREGIFGFLTYLNLNNGIYFVN